MENIIYDMARSAWLHHDEEMAGFVKRLLGEFDMEREYPDEWFYIGEHLAREYNGDDWMMENCGLYAYC